MLIKIKDIKSDNIQDIIKELELWPQLMSIITGNNLRGGDFLEALASDMLYSGNDVNTDDYLNIK